MSDADRAVQAMLERAIPRPDGAGPDWDDVLRRAAAPTAADGGTVVPLPRRGRRRVWYGLAAAAILMALVVNPAFGVGDRVLDWFRGTPAPERVKHDFAGMNPPDEVRELFRGPGVLADEGRGVIAIETRAGTAYLWAAPTETGGWCTYVELPSSGGVSCTDGPLTAPDFVSLGLDTTPAGEDSLPIASGHVAAEVASLELRFRNGSRAPIPLVDGFFLYELPKREPAVVVARGEDGQVLQRYPVQVEPPDVPPPTFRERTLIERETRIGRATLSVRDGEGAYEGGRCYRVRLSNGDSESCRDRGDAIGYTFHEWGGNPGERGVTVLLFGQVAPSVAALELVFADGERAHVPLTEQFFLFELPRERWSDARLRFVARDGAGRVVARERVQEHGF